VVDPKKAYQLLHVMGDPGARLATFGPNTPLNLGRPHMVKTGITDDYRDTWTIGYTPNLTIGVWVGNTDNRPMKEVLSSMSAGKIWRESMDTAIDFLQLPAEEFQRPSGLVDAQVCSGPACKPDLFPTELVPRGARIVQPGGQPVPTVVAPTAPAAPPARVAPAAAPQTEGTAPGGPAGGPTAQPAGPAPVLFPVAPIVAPQRTPGPPPQATPQPATPQPAAPQQTAQPMQPSNPTPAAKPQQPTPAAKPQQPTATPRRR
jgi:membrane peptidoglycan carboxypeptidase